MGSRKICWEKPAPLYYELLLPSFEMEDRIMAKKKTEKIIVAHIDSVQATLANKPYYVPSFRCGKHMTEKDRPRDKNWRNWL